MKEYWYVDIKNNKGPYTKNEVKNFYYNGEIGEFTLLWKKGMKKWGPFLQQKDEIINLKIKKLEFQENSYIQNNNILNITFKEKLEIQEKRKRGHSFFYLQILFCIFTFSMTIYFFSAFKSREDEITKFQNVSIEVLENLTKNKFSFKNVLNFGLDKDQKILYGNSNLNGNIEIEINFKSLDERINFYSSTSSSNGKFKFEALNFELGSKIKEGKYRVLVEFILRDWISIVKNLIRGDSLRYRYEGIVLLFSASNQSYLSKMKMTEEKRKVKERKSLIDLEEKIRTLNFMLINFVDQYKKNITKDKVDLKRYYRREISPLLQNLIIAEYNILTSEYKMNNHIIKMNRDFYLLAKKFSIWVFDILNDFKAINMQEEFFFKEAVKILLSQIKKNLIKLNV